MKFKEYIEKLNNLAKEYPSSLEMEVVYSADDEGNTYHKLYFEPSLFQFEDMSQYYLEEVGSYEEGSDDIALEDCNAVCIN